MTSRTVVPMHALLWTSALLGVVAVNGCRGAEAAEPPSRPVRGTEASAVARDTLLATGFTATGMALPIQRATLSTRLMGSVTAVLVQEGDRVTRGQVLARIDARELSARRMQVDAGLSAALAVAQEAETQARRFRALYADSAATRSQLDQVETGLARAAAGVATARGAQAELDALGDYATIRAPFAGMVTRRMVDPGAMAAPGAPLLEVQDDSRLRIAVAAPPAIAGRLRREQRLDGSIEGQRLEATVEGVVPAGATAMSTVNLLVPNPRGEFPAMSAATIRIPGAPQRAVVVPRSALVREGDLVGVRLRQGGAAALRWVTLGDVTDDDAAMVEIRSGLSAGDTVLVGSP